MVVCVMNEESNQGLTLLKKGQKGLFHLIFSRLGLILLLLAVQIFVMFGVFYWFVEFLPHIYGGMILFMAVMVLYLINSRMDASAKLTWMMVIMLLPVFGALLFWYTQRDLGNRTLKKRMNWLIDHTRKSIPQSHKLMEKLDKEAPEVSALTRYLGRSGCYPVYENTDVTYFPLGEKMWEEMLKQLEQAEHFIFLEYFIVDELSLIHI